MFEAQYLFKGDVIFSPWMSRSGDNLLINVEVAALDGTDAGLDTEVYMKNSEDTGDGTLKGTALAITAVGRDSKEFLGMEELVRYKFELPTAATDGSRVLFRMLSPVWFDDLV